MPFTLVHLKFTESAVIEVGMKQWNRLSLAFKELLHVVEMDIIKKTPVILLDNCYHRIQVLLGGYRTCNY